ncbi:MAG: MerR family transcriptional regulator [Pseudomonadota bacterium]
MRIGALATATGLSRDTLRFYEQRGLIQATRSENGYRTYAAQTVELLGYIRSAQRLGFSLGEITRQLPALRNCSGSSAEIVDLLLAKLAGLDTRMRELRQLRLDLLAQIARERSSADDCAAPATDNDGAFEALEY